MVSDIHADSPDNGSYTINDTEITTFLVQVGFVEGIIPVQQAFDSFHTACCSVFRNNKESGIMLINGLPVKFDYPTDVPFMVKPLLEILEKCLKGSMGQDMLLVLDTPTFFSEWTIQNESNGMLTLTMKWKRVEGNYETALNAVGLVRISVEEFIAEWAMLFKQIKEAFYRSESVVSGKDTIVLQRLSALSEHLTDTVGKIYRYQKIPG